MIGTKWIETLLLWDVVTLMTGWLVWNEYVLGYGHAYAYSYVGSYTSSSLSSSKFEIRSQNVLKTPSSSPFGLYMSSSDNETDEKKEKFSLSTLFGNSSSSSSSKIKVKVKANQSSFSKLPPHPSQVPHISPLNILAQIDSSDSSSNLRGGSNSIPKYTKDDGTLLLHPNVKSGVLKNGFSYIILPNKSPPGRFEAHLQVFSGSGKYLNFILNVVTVTCMNNIYILFY